MKKKRMLHRILAGTIAAALALQSPAILLAEEVNMAQPAAEAALETEPVIPETEPITEPEATAETELPSESETPSEPIPTVEAEMSEAPETPSEPEPTVEAEPPSETDVPVEPTPSVEAEPTPTVTPEPTVEPEITVTPVPTVTPEPTATPEPTPTQEPQVHIPCDVTGDFEQLRLNLTEPWYLDANGSYVSGQEGEGLLDYTGVSPELLLTEEQTLTAGMTVLFRLTQDGEARMVKPGDWFCLYLPEWMNGLRLTEGGQECFGNDTYIDGIWWELDSYNRVLKGTFAEAVEQTELYGIHGRVGLTFDWNRAFLTKEQSEYVMTLQSWDGVENLCTLRLPAMPEPTVTPEPSITPEPTVTPELSITPEPTVTPEPSITPEFTVTPIPSVTPQPMKNPALMLAPQAMAAPEPAADNDVVIEKDGVAQVQVIWQDAVADSGNTHPFLPGTLTCTVSGEEEAAYEISFDADGSLINPDEKLWQLLGWDKDVVPQVTTNGDNALNQNISVSDLPTKRTEHIEEGEIKEYTFQWSMSLSQDSANYPGYLMRVPEGAVYTMTPTTSFEAVVELRSGEAGADESEWAAVNESNLKLYIGGEEKKLADMTSGFVVGTPSPALTLADGTLVITGLPWCDASKQEYVYSAAVQGKNTDTEQQIPLNDGSGDVLIQSFNNGAVHNFGNVTDVVHNGGTLILTRYGELKFSATKYWLDDDKIKPRPDVNWELWRYTQGKGNYQSASPVRDEHGTAITKKVSGEGNAQEPIVVNFDEYTLPKYDANGGEYVYFVKESMSGENASLYEMVFGEPTADGVNIDADKAPNWISHNTTEADEAWSREGDTSVYNGGVLCNRLKDTVEVEQTKVWEAAHYQDDLHDVEVVFQLESRTKNDEQSDAAWTPVEDKNATQSMTGFTAEEMTKSISATMPKYDELGRELEYRWVESKIIEGGQEVPFEEKNGQTTFQLSHNVEAEKVDGEEYYVSETVTGENAKYPKGTIVNRLVGTTSYDVKKIWDAGITELPDSITVVLRQGDTHGGIQEFEYNLPNPEDGSREWNLKIDRLSNDNGGALLPKYDAEGHKYEYIVEEIEFPEGGDQYSADYEYNNRDTDVDTGADEPHDKEPDVNNVQITNKPVGVGRQIRVRKEWLDDGDAAHREEVTVEVYRNGIDGNALGAKDKLLATVTLNAANQWWTFVNVTEFSVEQGGKTYVGTREELLAQDISEDQFTADNLYNVEDAYYIKETSMGSRTVSEEVLSLRGYPTITGAGSKHGYEVLYANADENGTRGTAPDEEGYYTVYNRRIGQIDIAAEKTWVDGGQPAEVRENLEAELQLTCDSPNVKFTDDGLSLGADTYGNNVDYTQPIYSEDMNTPVSHTQPLTGGGDGEDQNKETVYFYNLPKYDYNGRVLHYSVSEDVTDPMKAADYSVSVNNTGYEVVTGDDKHGEDGHDKKTVAVTNRRTGVKSVEFHKKWIDKAVYEDRHRPDIFLTLYRLDSECEDNKPVPDKYIDREWKAHNEQGDTEYEWTCVFDNLPKYDENGAEITYYAIEETHAHTTEFDYLPVQYGTGKELDNRLSRVSWDETAKQYVVTHNAGAFRGLMETYAASEERPWVLTADDGKQVLKEEGWFVNELRAAVSADGQKEWENIPEGFPVEELPKLNFILKQKLEGAPDENYKEVAQINDVVSTALTFNFTFRYLGENSQDGKHLGADKEAWTQLLPKYNPADGALYEYTVTESIAASEEDKGKIETAYEALPGEVNNYVITNTYNAVGHDNGNEGEISVKKNWNSAHDAVKDDITAQAAFELHRFYENADGTKYLDVENGSGKVVETVYLQAPKEEVKFGTQLAVAPNGKPYLYYIKEIKIGGFESNLEASGGETVQQEADLNWPTEVDEGNCSEVFQFKQVQNESGKEARLNEKYAPVTLSAENTYKLETTEDTVQVEATKGWDDCDNLTGIRPDEISFTLRRYANSQPGATVENSIGKQTLGTVTLKKVAEDQLHAEFSSASEAGTNVLGELRASAEIPGKSKWVFTVSNLDKYAPNGAEWEYELEEETVPTGYSCDNPIAKTAMRIDDALLLEPVLNESVTSLTVYKEWAQNSGLQRFETEYALQVKAGNGSWQWAANYFTDNGSVENFLEDIKETKKISAAARSAGWNSLPAFGSDTSGAIVPISYRAVEIRIGDKDVRFGNGAENEVYPRDSDPREELSTKYATEQPQELLYTPSQEDGTASGHDPQECTVTNTPMDGTVSLEITKTWENDSDNKFHSRPTENGEWTVRFLIQRKTEGETAYENVQDNSGNAYIVTVAASDAKDSNTAVEGITGLPKVDENGEEYAYAAREVVKVGGSWEMVGDNHKIPGYEVSGNTGDAVKEKAPDGNITYKNSITNTFQTTQRSLLKTWHDEDVSDIRPDKETFAEALTLWVREEGKTAWEKAAEKWPEAGSFLAPQVTGENRDSWTITYQKLPKTAPDGKAYVYGVSEATVPGYSEAHYEGTTETIDGKLKILILPEENTKASAVIKNYVTEFYLKKTDESENALPDFSKVVLELTGAESENAGYHASWTYEREAQGAEKFSVSVKRDKTEIYSGSNESQISIKGLPLGTYSLAETTTPDGYLPLPDGYTITLKAGENGGTVLETGASQGGTLVSTGMTSNRNDTAVVKNRSIEFSLFKTDSRNQSLEGAEFKLSGVFPAHYGNENGFYTLVTGSNGLASVKEKDAEGQSISLEGLLIVGETYTLKETKAPDDYTLLEGEFQFTVNEDGSLSAAGAVVPGYAIAAEDSVSNKIIVMDEQISITVKKVNESDAPLSGAEFKLEEVTESGKEASAKLIAKNLVTDAQGILNLAGLNHPTQKLVAGKTYKLTELKAPDGYVLPKEEARSIVFEVTQDGKVKFLQGEDSSLFSGDNTNQIVMANLHEFYLKKLDNETGEEISSSGLELTIKDDKQNTVFTWGHTAEGYVLHKGSTHAVYRLLSLDDRTGAIRGLPAGTYRVSETGTPHGYATVEDFTFTLTSDNEIEVEPEAAGAEAEELTGGSGEKLWVLKITDNFIRGHVTLTKTLGDVKEPLAGVHFDLYRVNGLVDGSEGAGADDAPDTRIAEHLVTDEKGQWTSADNTATFTDAPGEETRPFSEGLRNGAYYFKETQAAADSALDEAPVSFTIDGSRGEVPAVAEAEMSNTAFSADLTLTKLDAVTQEPINGDVKFNLQKISNDADGKTYAQGNTLTPYEAKDENGALTGVTAEISEDGTLTFNGLTKGTYRLTEVYARGYDLTEAFAADVVIGEADNGKTIVVQDEAEDTEPKHFRNIAGTLTEKGIENPRDTAAVSLIKVSAGDEAILLNQTEFKLQRKSEDSQETDSYADCMTGLFTGGSYVFKESAEEGEKSAPEEAKEAQDGTLEIQGLPWGSYRLVEVTPTDGYVTADQSAQENAPVMKEFTIGRSDFDESQKAELSLGTLENQKTKLILQKQNSDGEALAGAVFTLAGERFAGTDKSELELTTDKGGSIVLEGILAAGVEYTLNEKMPPAGYSRIAGECRFVLAADGTVQMTENAGEGYGLTLAGSFENRITVTDTPVTVSFLKRLTGDSSENGMEGAEFELTPEEGKTLADGSSSVSWTSKKEPETLSGLFISGDTYTLKETKAPLGAAPVREDNKESFVYTFKVDEYGKVTDMNPAGKDNALSFDGETGVLTVWDAPTSLVLQKSGTDLSPDGTELLAGCTFALTGVFAEGRYEGQEHPEAGEHTLMITTNGQDGIGNALLGRVIVGNTYTLKEVEAPDGYALGGEIRFTVAGTKTDGNGKEQLVLEIEEADAGKGYEVAVDEDGNPVILQRDYPVELVLGKTDQEGKALAGAEFELIGRFPGEEAESTRTVTADKDGKVNLTKQLMESSGDSEYIYCLRETKAPEGYAVLKGDIFFKMETTQEEGGRRSRAVLLFGEGQTPEELKGMVSLEPGEIPRLRIVNLKEEIPVPPISPKPTITPEATVTPEPTVTPEATVTPEPTGAPEATVTPVPTPIPEPTGTPGENVTPEQPEVTPGQPEVTPGQPTVTPEAIITITPEATITVTPGAAVTEQPTATPKVSEDVAPTATPKPSRGAKTGDETDALSYLLMIFAAVLVFASADSIRRKKKH